MKKLIVLTSLLCVLFSSCKFGPYTWDFTEDNVEDRVKEIKNLDGHYLPSQTNGSSKYSFIVVADMHFGAARYAHHDEEFFAWFTKQLNQADQTKVPQFIVNVGDIADRGKNVEFEEYYNWYKKVREIAKAQKGFDDYKIYAIAGNHDLYEDGQDYYKDWVYPSIYAYHFVFKNDPTTAGFDFVFLDTANGSMGSNQMKSFEKIMPQNGIPKIVFSHYPVFAGGAFIMDMQDTLERSKILTICGENNSKILLSGHIHKLHTYDYGSLFEASITSYAQNDYVNVVTVDEKAGTCVTQEVCFN